jgi:hypothetical protein
MAVSVQSYKEQVGSSFHVMLGDDLVDIVLIDVTDKSEPLAEQFTLLFRGPLDRFFEQNTYDLGHDVLGLEPIFIVPVGRQADGFLYQAVFHRFYQKEVV